MRIAAVYFNDTVKRDTTYWNVKREDFKVTCTDIEVEIKPRKKLEAERLTTKLKISTISPAPSHHYHNTDLRDSVKSEVQNISRTDAEKPVPHNRLHYVKRLISGTVTGIKHRPVV